MIALSEAKTIEDADNHSGALRGIAEAQAEAGDIKASQSTFFSAYWDLLFPVLLSCIRGCADVQSLETLGMPDYG